MPYTEEDKRAALDNLNLNKGDFQTTSAETGIRVPTLKKWAQAQRAQQMEHLHENVQDLHLQLAQSALHLAQAIDGAIDGAPLNQLTSALGTVIDRFLKIEEHLSQLDDQTSEQVIRVEYKDPDGSIHSTPLWARGDPDQPTAIQGRGVRQALWQDGDREDDRRAGSYEREGVLVARADLSDGDASLARPENLSADSRSHTDQRNGASHRLSERGRAGDSQYAQPG